MDYTSGRIEAGESLSTRRNALLIPREGIKLRKQSVYSILYLWFLRCIGSAAVVLYANRIQGAVFGAVVAEASNILDESFQTLARQLCISEFAHCQVWNITFSSVVLPGLVDSSMSAFTLGVADAE